MPVIEVDPEAGRDPGEHVGQQRSAGPGSGLTAQLFMIEGGQHLDVSLSAMS